MQISSFNHLVDLLQDKDLRDDLRRGQPNNMLTKLVRESLIAEVSHIHYILEILPIRRTKDGKYYKYFDQVIRRAADDNDDSWEEFLASIKSPLETVIQAVLVVEAHHKILSFLDVK